MDNAGVWAQFSQQEETSYFDGVALLPLAERYGTPLYVYSAAHILAQYHAYHEHGREASVALHYAVKANSNLSILQLLARAGAGFDIVSGGELARVLEAGGDPKQIVFSGVAKSDAELRAALRAGIGCFNAESRFELERIAAISEEEGVVAPIAIRVNPDVDPQTHPYISTGLKENKFGVSMDDALALYQYAAGHPALRVLGMSGHIGSQITTLQPFLDALDNMLDLAATLEEAGITLTHIDMGGGLGIVTPEQTQIPQPSDLSAALLDRLSATPYALHLEPGRSLVGNAGYLLSSVVGVKDQSGHHFIMLDAGMNDYIRPALYQVRPAFRNLSHNQGVERRSEMVGPVCETGDTFARAYPMSAQAGDVLAMAGVGAYGMAMSGDYNSRPKAAEVLIEDGAARLIRRRQDVAELWAQEIDYLS
ncbi:diaminopimelate decarboxylase [Suttonella sp. R2A3]|uniref:diaminopimelate decarboxylase n=1 Tax=Suttonella sp. R2A3 TaxID=2908648 RepID=UPI001F1B24A4|nr:diaminopimelate decarboxylase [Suttonella sp. R2A3]UJF24786.1 diaminopimelate decarboxylase [Suttonella sp. R2A3]